MKILIDKHIPFLSGVFERRAAVQYLEPREFTKESVRDADVLIIRTVVRCDRELLDGSSVSHIASATIGFDHIDTGYCASRGIVWNNCPGCNASGVADYVMAGIDYWLEMKKNIERHPLTIGIIGVGNVGKQVERLSRERGYGILLCDPPRAAKEGSKGFCDIDYLVERADIISLHTPLTKEGENITYHLLSKSLIDRLKPQALVINAARGGVADEAALLQREDIDCIIDTWEGEPVINGQLLRKAIIGTYHIAGYTQEGKHNASRMCLDALQQHYPTLKGLSIAPLPQSDKAAGRGWIKDVSDELKAHPQSFALLRERYRLR